MTVRSSCSHANLVHGECRHHNQSIVLRLQIRLTHQLDGLVHAVGQQHLLRLQSQKRGHLAFHRFAFRIAGQLLRLHLPQTLQHSRRTSARCSR